MYSWYLNNLNHWYIFYPSLDQHQPATKAAMDRPQRSRGVATAPGVQRKAPSSVIQRENKPKGPRLEEQLATTPARRQ